MAMQKKRAAMYARFSSDLQNERSIEDQFDVCRAIAAKEKLEIVAEFSDRAKSGTSMFDRDGILELKLAAKRKEFDVVVVESQSRLSRDQADINQLWKAFRFRNVKILTREGYATPITVMAHGFVNEQFITNLGNAVRYGHNGRVREGRIPGAVSFGYRRTTKPGEREIDPAQAKIVVRIFSEYAEGRSPRMIVRGLRADGISNAKGNNWCPQSLTKGGANNRGMLGNPLYIGQIVWNRNETRKNPENYDRPIKHPSPEAMITVDVPHLRIIDQRLWDAVQQVRQGRADAKFGPGGKIVLRAFTPRSEHLMTGLLRCGVCFGHMRIADSSPTRGHRVACAAAHQSDTCEHRKTYYLGRIEKMVIDGMRSKLTDPEMLAEIARGHHERYSERQRAASTAMAAAVKRRNALQTKIDRIIDVIADGDVGDTPVRALKERLKVLEIERLGTVEQIRLLDADTKVVRLHPESLETYRANVEELFDALSRDKLAAENRVAFHNLMDSIVIHPTPKRAPYSCTLNGRMSAIMGIDLFPTVRSAQEMLAAEGVTYTDSGNSALTEFQLSVKRTGAISAGRVVCFGEWQERKAA